MGLRVDIDQIYRDNSLKDGLRKFNQILINTGDKMTSKERIDLIAQNKARYGLSAEYVQ